MTEGVYISGGDPRGWALPRHASRPQEFWLWVTDLDSSPVRFTAPLPFIVDTGSPFTVIPGTFIEESAAGVRTPIHRLLPGMFGKDRTGNKRPVEMRPLNSDSGSRGTFFGFPYRASLSLFGECADAAPVLFDRSHLLVAHDLVHLHCILGLDWLDQVILVRDCEHLTLWPTPRNQRSHPSEPGAAGRSR